MTVTAIHFILTYTCTFECDHCFLYCGPQSEGTFSISQIKGVLEEIKKLDSIDSVCFEGGEPFLTYPVMIEAIKQSKQIGLETAIETNSFWATSLDNALLWLQPLKDAGLDLLETSDDQYHFGETKLSPAANARKAAKQLGIELNTICIDNPTISALDKIKKGEPIYQGSPKFRGRAVEKLTEGLPRKSKNLFTECPFEDLRNPGRVHIDPFGNIHLCQGISLGNFMKRSLAELITTYEPDAHPICGPLLKGGPLELEDTYGIDIGDTSVDTCHHCAKVCMALLDRFPEFLTPKAVYGLDKYHPTSCSCNGGEFHS